MAEPFLGEVKIVSFNFPPKGWALCNGQIMPINQNQALFSLLGTQYGGDGQRTFALPNLQGCTPIHMGQGFVIGQKGGEVGHALTITEMPAHVHVPAATTNSPAVDTVANNVWCSSSANPYGPTPNVNMSPSAIAFAGGSQPHLNLSPYLVLNMVVALVGIFPSPT